MKILSYLKVLLLFIQFNYIISMSPQTNPEENVFLLHVPVGQTVVGALNALAIQEGVCTKEGLTLPDLKERVNETVIVINEDGSPKIPGKCKKNKRGDFESGSYESDDEEKKQKPMSTKKRVVNGIMIGCTGAAVLASNYFMPGATQTMLVTTALGENLKGITKRIDSTWKVVTIGAGVCAIGYGIDH